LARPTVKAHFHSGNTAQTQQDLVGNATGVLTTLNTFASGYYSNSSGALYVPLTVSSATDGWRISNFNLSGEGTLEMWVKFDGWSLTGTVVSDSSQHRIAIDGTALKLWTYIHPGQGIHFDLSGTSRLTCSTCNISADTWTYFKYTWSDVLNFKKIFINGAEVASSSASFTIGSTAGLNMDIGHYIAETVQGLRGWVDGVIYRNETILK
jgi:hypothetical protein